jgi:CHRD domain-containing protein
MTIAHHSLVLAAAGLLGLVLAACGGDEGGGGEVTSDTSTTSSSAPPATTNVNLEAKMSGKEEVPGPGVTDGAGVAEVRIEGEEICYKLNATMGEMPTAAHIHTGAAGASGPVLVNLMPAFTKGESGFKAENCLPPASAAPQIAENPAGYYVNVHTAEHPNGAMRGQLAKAPY